MDRKIERWVGREGDRDLRYGDDEEAGGDDGVEGSVGWVGVVDVLLHVDGERHGGVEML